MNLVDVYVQIVADRFGVTPERIQVYAARHMLMTHASLYQALDFLILLQERSGQPPAVTLAILDIMEAKFNAEGDTNATGEDHNRL